MQDQDSISNWPQEVLLAFFKNLEPAQIGPCAEVCKKWFQMSKDNEFWRQKCVEKWSSLPKEKDCKRNWLIPTKDGDTLIDWRRVYGVKKHWPDVIKCLEQYYDILDKSPQQTKTIKAQKTALKKLLDRVAKKDWIALADFKQLALNTMNYCGEREFNNDSIELLDTECVDSAIQFFLKMDQVMISRSNSSRVKQIGTGLQFMNIAQNRPPKGDKISLALLWSFVLYTHEYVKQLEIKGLEYSGGIEAIFQISTVFQTCAFQEGQEWLSLIPKVIDILIYAINTWNIEADLVFQQNNSIRKIDMLMQTLTLPLKIQEGILVVDVFINALKSISPPKTSRESLTLAYFKNQLQKVLFEPAESRKLNEWYDSLPTPTGSTQDKTLVLYHYENMKNLDTARPTEEPKKNAACSFLLEAFLDLDEKWQAKVMTKFLHHSKTFRLLLTKEQEDILFGKLKELSEQSKAKDRVEKWIVQLAINCERISEYKELVISTITDPANSNLLGMGAYSNTDLLRAAVEEYEREPRDAIEAMLLKFGEEINMIPEGKLPPNVFSILITVIGKQIALRRAQNIPNEDIEQDSDDSMDDDDDGDLSDEDQDEDEEDDENSQDDMDEGDEHVDEKGIGLEIMEYSFDNSEDEDIVIEYGTRELVNLLISVAARMNDGEIIKNNLPNMLNIIKTEFNNIRIPQFFGAIVALFCGRTEGNVALVADPIAAAVVDWIHQTNLNHRYIPPGPLSKMLKTLVRTCSKNFLTADVVDVLLTWIDNGLNDGMNEIMSLWGVLANHAVDPTPPANLLYQRLETMLKSDDDEEKHQALVYMTHLLQADLFQNPKFVPLLNMAWKSSYTDLLDGTAVTIREAGEFIGASAKHYPSIVLENLKDTLDVFEKIHENGNFKSLSVPYAYVINLVEDPATWIHHTKIFLETIEINGFIGLGPFARELPILFKLLSPDHPHHKLLLEDSLRPKIQEIFKELKETEDEKAVELSKYYGV